MSISYFIRSMIIINFRAVKAARRQGNFIGIFLDVYKRAKESIKEKVFLGIHSSKSGVRIKHKRPWSMKRHIFHSKCVDINHIVEMYWNRAPSVWTKCWLQTLNSKLNSNQPIFHTVTHTAQCTYNSICSTYLLLFQFCSVRSMVLVICT